MELTSRNARSIKEKKQLKEIYYSSFPKEERMPFWLMILMSFLWNTKFKVYYDHGNLIGFVYFASMFKEVFIMFFATDEKYRNKGYGSAILSNISSMYPNKRIIVSIEPIDEKQPDNELRKRRKAFYERNGFLTSGYQLKLNGIIQDIHIKNGPFKKSSFIIFFLFYSSLAIIPKVWKNNLNESEINNEKN